MFRTKMDIGQMNDSYLWKIPWLHGLNPKFEILTFYFILMLERNQISTDSDTTCPTAKLSCRENAPAFSRSASALCCVPGLARLLNGDVRYYDTNIGQSPYPA